MEDRNGVRRAGYHERKRAERRHALAELGLADRWPLVEATARGVPECVVWREVRVRARMSADDLARAVGVTRKTLRRWELAEREPSPGKLRALVLVLTRLDNLEPVDPLTRRGRALGP